MKQKLHLLVGILLIVSLACSGLPFVGSDEPEEGPSADVVME